MPLPEVLKLPEVIVEGTSRLIGDSCPVCLDAYRLDDKVNYVYPLSSFSVLEMDTKVFLGKAGEAYENTRRWFQTRVITCALELCGSR